MHYVLALLLALTTNAQTITGIEKALNQYFFIDKVPVIKAALEANRARLEAIADPRSFVKQTTAVIYSVVHDKHIRVHYSPDPLPVDKPGPETPAEVAMDKKIDQFMDFGYSSSARLPGNIGYLRLAFFPPSAKGMYDSAMKLVAHTDGLIIDLRGNQGGAPEAVDYLMGYFFGQPVEVTGFFWRNGAKVTHERRYTSRVKGALYTKPVYILTDSDTISGGEQFTYDMKSLHRARLVGATTAGGANIGGPVRVNEHFSIFIPVGTARNPYTGTNWEGTGVAPDVAVKSKQDALLTAYTIMLKTLKYTFGPAKQDRDMALQDPVMALDIALPYGRTR